METDVMDLVRAATPLSGTIDATDHEQIAALLGAISSDDYMNCEATSLALLPKFSYAVRYYLELDEEFRLDSPAEASFTETKRIYSPLQNILSLLTDRNSVADGYTLQTGIAAQLVQILKHVFTICEVHNIDVFAELRKDLHKSAAEYMIRGSESLEPKQDTVKKPTI